MTPMSSYEGPKASRQEVFADTLKRLLEDRGYEGRRKDVADGINVSTSSITQYVGGRIKPGFETLVEIANFFNVSLDYLVFGDVQSRVGDRDIKPLASYLDVSVNRLQSAASRQAALTSRIGDALADRIGEVAARIVAGESSEAGESGQAPSYFGLMDDNETLRLEQHAVSTRLLTMDLAYDILQPDSPEGAAPGRFLEVVADNLDRSRSVRYLVPKERDWTTYAKELRKQLGQMCSPDNVTRYLEIRTTVASVFVGIGIYELDVLGLQRADPMLWATVQDFVDEKGALAYVIPPSDALLADSLLDLENLHRAVASFDKLWHEAKPVTA